MKLRILIIGLVCGSVALAADAGAELFQKAVTQERAAGNLDEAIKLYQRVAREYASNRPLAAKALVQEARCYEKLGQDKAVKLYEQVARDFGDQPEQATAARERLAALGAGAKSKGGAAMVAHQIPLPPTAAVPAQSDGMHVFYVDYQGGGLIAARMDGTDRRVILPLPANREKTIPNSSSVSPDGKKVVVNLIESDKDSFVVVAADGSGVQAVYRKPVNGVQPQGGWSPDGNHFLIDTEEPDGTHTVGILSAVDSSLQKIRNDFAVKGKARLVALTGAGGGIFSRDGKYVVFGVRTGTGTQSEIRIVAVDGSYGGKLVDHPSSNGVIDFTPDGKYLLFQSDRSGLAGIYSLAVSNGRAQGDPVLIKQEAGAFSDAASLTRDGTLFYSMGEQVRREIFTAKLDAASGTLAGTPAVFSGPTGMMPESCAWSPDGQKFAYLSGRNHTHGGGDATLIIRTLISGKEVEYRVPPEVQAVSGWTPDGRGIYTEVRRDAIDADRLFELHSVSVDTGADTRIAVIPGAKAVDSVRLAQDGNALLITIGDQLLTSLRPTGTGLVRLDPRTGQQTELIPRGTVSDASISPDGTQVAAFDCQANSARLLLKPLTGGDWKALATLDGTGYTALHWMPDGTLIFAKEGSPNSTLFRISVSGGKPEKIAQLPFLNYVRDIRVHPDGKQLAFTTYVSHAELWALENFLPKETAAR